MMNKTEAEKFPIMNYYYFIGNKLIPNFIIRYMLNHKWHKRHPRLLTEAGELINRIENIKSSILNMFKLLYYGEWDYVINRILKKDEYYT